MRMNNNFKSGCQLTMGGWTAVGQTLDTKSSLSPMSVCILSRVCPMDKKVQSLSSRCLIDVEILSRLMVFGQILDKKIQHLSKDCPIEQPMHLQILMFETFWTYFCLDRRWTKPGLYATLVGLPSPSHRSQTLTGQILDQTDSGQNQDLMAHPWPKHRHWTLLTASIHSSTSREG